jgi:hypothetical protein
MNTKTGLLIGLMAAAIFAASRGPLAAQVAVPHDIDWQTSPLDLDLRGMNGERYIFSCPPGKPVPNLVHGSGPYTDSSSICTTAVHAGAIRPASGGDVTIEIRPGQSGGYRGSERNYIQSNSYDQPWSGSFVVVVPAGAGSSRNAALVPALAHSAR